jgi:hypothetical protein
MEIREGMGTRAQERIKIATRRFWLNSRRAILAHDSFLVFFLFGATSIEEAGFIQTKLERFRVGVAGVNW